MSKNEWPQFEQEWGDINTDIDDRGYLAGESSTILRDVYLAVTFSHTPLCYGWNLHTILSQQKRLMKHDHSKYVSTVEWFCI